MKNFLNLVQSVQEHFISEEEDGVDDVAAPEDIESDDSTDDATTKSVYMLELIRQALLINRDEIDDSEYMYIQEPVSPDNIAQLDEIITSIIGKAGNNIGDVTPLETY